jgi:hypothetical protein
MKVCAPSSSFLGRERMHFNLELAVAKYLASPLKSTGESLAAVIMRG